MGKQSLGFGGTMVDITVRSLHEEDLPEADRILRLAFGTFLGLPEPATFQGDADYVRTRWRADPAAAFCAEMGGQLAGSNFATIWGSLGFFGPLTVHPDLWGQGVAKRLMEPILESFQARGTGHTGLFTFAESQKHIGLYQKFGFWPRFLTMIMSKPVVPTRVPPGWTRFSALPDKEREVQLGGCRQLTDELYAGLDVSSEIRSVAAQGLGDTVMIWNDGELAGLGICHCGPGSEAGSGAGYIKFGAVRPGPTAEQDFDRLLNACEALSAEKRLDRLIAGVNTARHEAYRHLLARGFRTDFQGVAMERPNDPGYNRPGIYLIDDWR